MLQQNLLILTNQRQPGIFQKLDREAKTTNYKKDVQTEWPEKVSAYLDHRESL